MAHTHNELDLEPSNLELIEILIDLINMLAYGLTQVLNRV